MNRCIKKIIRITFILPILTIGFPIVLILWASEDNDQSILDFIREVYLNERRNL